RQMCIRDRDLAMKQRVEEFVSAQTWHQQFKTIGVMLFQQDKQFIYPLIHIPKIGSLIWENSCGSGAASIGVLVNYLTDHDIQDYLVNQPGGSIIVSSRKSEQNEYQTTIKGQVSTVATGQAYIEQETMTQI
ncbi:MAG: diaminopimelate epimerase, partial [Staphylococcus epidermidis]|nr:diaminopimelate epimerase [Staphylococcus epidermidis]